MWMKIVRKTKADDTVSSVEDAEEEEDCNDDEDDQNIICRIAES